MLTLHWAAGKGMKARPLMTKIDILSTYYLIYAYSTTERLPKGKAKALLTTIDKLSTYYSFHAHSTLGGCTLHRGRKLHH
jgi:hypothetical protein